MTPNGKQVIPDPGVRVWEFTGAMWNPLDHLGPIWDAFQDLWNTATGDPVDPTTGLLNLSKTDMTEPGRLPLDVTRTYRQGDTQVRDFGVGQTFAYDMFLQSRDNAGVSHQYDWVDLILPSGNRIHFDRINGCPTHDSPCSDFQNGIFEADSTPTRYFHAQIQWRTATADGWNLTLQDGTVMHFGENAPLQDVTDRFGNKITISRTAGQDGAITQVTSSSGRWIHFNYNDPNCSSCVSQAVDQSGRTVNYTYSAAKQLTDVQDVDGNHTVYTWNPSAVDQITAIKDPRQNTYLQNTYDANDRVHVQTTPSGTFQFDYTVDGKKCHPDGLSRTRDGNVTRYVMNGTGVITSATSAMAPRSPKRRRSSAIQRPSGDEHHRRLEPKDHLLVLSGREHPNGDVPGDLCASTCMELYVGSPVPSVSVGDRPAQSQRQRDLDERRGDRCR